MTTSPAALARQQATQITAAANHTAALFERDAADVTAAVKRCRRAGEDLSFALDDGARVLAEMLGAVSLSAGAALLKLEGALIAPPPAEPEKLITAPPGTAEAFRHDPEFWPDATREEARRDETVRHNNGTLGVTREEHAAAKNGVPVRRIESFPFAPERVCGEAPSPEMLDLARRAVEAQEARKGEDVKEWSERLAKDACHPHAFPDDAVVEAPRDRDPCPHCGALAHTGAGEAGACEACGHRSPALPDVWARCEAGGAPALDAAPDAIAHECEAAPAAPAKKTRRRKS